MLPLVLLWAFLTLTEATNSNIIIRSVYGNIEYKQKLDVSELPASLDWREKGVILPVQDQVCLRSFLNVCKIY